uniref:Uncharacterized protein n=1 Tax=Picea sitchensis TaxID=3332 RepID=B8LPE4_PICSI|nr:unknown [Picea sitchensis]
MGIITRHSSKVPALLERPSSSLPRRMRRKKLGRKSFLQNKIITNKIPKNHNIKLKKKLHKKNKNNTDGVP